MFPKGIEDIQLVNGEVWTMRRQVWTAKRVEEFLSGYRYNGNNCVRDPQVENYRLPAMMAVFQYMLSFGKFPTEDEILDQYVSEWFVQTAPGRLRLKQDTSGVSFSWEGIKGRVLRSYPSLVREFHFYLLCAESGFFDEARYSLYSDYWDGIDLMVTYQGVPYYVSLFTQTNRSKEWKKVKDKRHDYSQIKEIQLWIDPLRCHHRVGDISLYDYFHVNLLLRKIQTYGSAHDQIAD